MGGSSLILPFSYPTPESSLFPAHSCGGCTDPRMNVRWVQRPPQHKEKMVLVWGLTRNLGSQNSEVKFLPYSAHKILYNFHLFFSEPPILEDGCYKQQHSSDTAICSALKSPCKITKCKPSFCTLCLQMSYPSV